MERRHGENMPTCRIVWFFPIGSCVRWALWPQESQSGRHFWSCEGILGAPLVRKKLRRAHEETPCRQPRARQKPCENPRRPKTLQRGAATLKEKMRHKIRAENITEILQIVQNSHTNPPVIGVNSRTPRKLPK